MIFASKVRSTRSWLMLTSSTGNFASALKMRKLVNAQTDSPHLVSRNPHNRHDYGTTKTIPQGSNEGGDSVRACQWSLGSLRSIVSLSVSRRQLGSNLTSSAASTPMHVSPLRPRRETLWYFLEIEKTKPGKI